MQENTTTSADKQSSNPDDDGRNKEWQDRARVNLEEVPEGKHTNIERDFEPEPSPEQEKKKGEKDGSEY